jgi:hypothetical protein
VVRRAGCLSTGIGLGAGCSWSITARVELHGGSDHTLSWQLPRTRTHRLRALRYSPGLWEEQIQTSRCSCSWRREGELWKKNENSPATRKDIHDLGTHLSEQTRVHVPPGMTHVVEVYFGQRQPAFPDKAHCHRGRRWEPAARNIPPDLPQHNFHDTTASAIFGEQATLSEAGSRWTSGTKGVRGSGCGREKEGGRAAGPGFFHQCNEFDDRSCPRGSP